MANTARGEVEAKGRDGASYVFKLGSNAICQIEDTTGKSAMALFGELQQGGIRLTTMREFVKACIQGRDLDNAAAGEVIDDIGVLPLLDAMTKSMLLTFNAPEAADPPKPAKKTGGAGTSKTPRP